MKITSADFVASCPGPQEWPREGLPEAAFAGRSNVGKSSLLNTLMQRKKLARTSSTPGRTQAVNFFRVNGKFMFADLPGYGYAQVSKKEREAWRKMIEHYFAERGELKAVVLVLDLRRDPGPDERDLIGSLTGLGIAVILAATKSDKVSQPQRAGRVRSLAAALGVPRDRVVIFSAATGEGRDRLGKELQKLLG